MELWFIPAEFPEKRYAVLPDEVVMAVPYSTYAVEFSFVDPHQTAAYLQSQLLRKCKMNCEVTTQPDLQGALLGRYSTFITQGVCLRVKFLQVDSRLYQQ